MMKRFLTRAGSDVKITCNKTGGKVSVAGAARMSKSTLPEWVTLPNGGKVYLLILNSSSAIVTLRVHPLKKTNRKDTKGDKKKLNNSYII